MRTQMRKKEEEKRIVRDTQHVWGLKKQNEDKIRYLLLHFAMFCMTKSDRDQINSCIRDLLAEPVG